MSFPVMFGMILTVTPAGTSWLAAPDRQRLRKRADKGRTYEGAAHQCETSKHTLPSGSTRAPAAVFTRSAQAPRPNFRRAKRSGPEQTASTRPGAELSQGAPRHTARLV